MGTFLYTWQGTVQHKQGWTGVRGDNFPDLYSKDDYSLYWLTWQWPFCFFFLIWTSHCVSTNNYTMTVNTTNRVFYQHNKFRPNSRPSLGTTNCIKYSYKRKHIKIAFLEMRVQFYNICVLLFMYCFITTVIKTGNTDVVSVILNWTFECAICSLCRNSKRSFKYWWVIKQAIRYRTGIDVVLHSVPKNLGTATRSHHDCFLPNPFLSITCKIFGAAQRELLTEM
jgi:hypothetical protein